MFQSILSSLSHLLNGYLKAPRSPWVLESSTDYIELSNFLGNIYKQPHAQSNTFTHSTQGNKPLQYTKIVSKCSSRLLPSSMFLLS